MTKSIEDNLISQLGLDDLPQEKKIELIMKWGNLVQKDIIMRILRELPEKDKKELDELLAEKGENMEDIYKFLENQKKLLKMWSEKRKLEREENYRQRQNRLKKERGKNTAF